MGQDDMDDSSLSKKKIIEAVLFVSSSSIPLAEIAKLVDISTAELSSIIKEMNDEYAETHGICIMIHNNRVQLTTSPDLAEKIEEFLGLEITTTLSRAALESLAIIAYKQPITRPQIDEIRGVNSDGVVRTLLSKGLIEEMGRADSMGKPILYGTTEDFLHYFGMKSIEELPEISNLAVVGGNTNHTILKQ
ncbi:MAG: SMC-Scp complex subunit ScpB [Anaerolineaceae bacterium]|jgi:segregation and condensation protein B|nr:MAG: SMC-Scp complex subunit ScpB [Anaerolineaceae bacterium]